MDNSSAPPKKPSLWREPGAWFRRKLQLKLTDALGPLKMRVLDRVGFGALKTDISFKHIIDVGVADGTHDLYERFPNGFFDLIEPSPQHYDTIETDILSKYHGRFHKIALGREEKQADLYLTGRTGSTLLSEYAVRRDDVERVAVPVRRLDRVLTSEDIKPPCLLKIDTEGYEREVLEGARGLLPYISCIVVEVHFRKPDAYQPIDILNLLSQYDFHLTNMLDHHVRAGYVVCADLVFERGR